MEEFDAKRLKELDEENSELKKMIADVSLEYNAIRNFGAKTLMLSEEQECVSILVDAEYISLRLACLLVLASDLLPP
ncbi:hypothetical protein KL866_13150 [Alteromonas sp. ALT199]|nr:hypothetical protein [Alteromonas sp. ALT199]